MLINLASFVFAAGLMAFVFSYLYRRLEGWDTPLCSLSTGSKWFVRLMGVALMFGSGALFSYSLKAPEAYISEPVDEWLGLMDGANYQDAWSRGAQGLQHSLSANEFARLAERRRKPLGEVIDRAQVATLELSALPDGREGVFKLHIYRTLFENGTQLEETVVTEEEAHQWKILNYNIGDAPRRR